MPLFTLATARSCELPAAHQLAERLSETDGIIDLAEAANAEEALASVIVGIAADPFGGEEYEPDELANRHFIARVFSDAEDSYLAGLSPEALGTPREGGVFSVYLRRQIRESEDRTDAYNFFWDRVSAISQQLIANAEQLSADTDKNRFKSIQRRVGPAFGERRTEGGQGVHLIALLEIVWGDVETE